MDPIIFNYKKDVNLERKTEMMFLLSTLLNALL